MLSPATVHGVRTAKFGAIHDRVLGRRERATKVFGVLVGLDIINLPTLATCQILPHSEHLRGAADAMNLECRGRVALESLGGAL